ncbi:hypothetical protein RN333_09775 [Enterobacter kobei]|uniref:hypothetical protein n=1 Tax=Enterobacter kobei TaxID=208224 RepID=UPI0028D863D7|nr:hypothetical protein [Enterobacter kobei]WNP36449.1 hypothetical protein RN333_09775 [Enterobacter kobei]
MKKTLVALCAVVVSFTAYAAETTNPLSDDVLSYQAELICSAKFRTDAAKSDFKIKKGIINATDPTPFNEDVLEAYREVVKYHPGIEKIDADTKNVDSCKPNVIEKYREKHPLK